MRQSRRILNSFFLFLALSLVLFGCIKSKAVVQEVLITPDSAILAPGETVDLKASVVGTNLTDLSVSWSSSNNAVASVDDGLVTANAGGTATIKATSRQDETTFGLASILVQATPGILVEDQKLVASDGAEADEFGFSGAISGNYMIVGSWQDDDKGSSSGSVYVFERQPGGSWTEVQKLLASDGVDQDRLGVRVSLDGNTAVIQSDIDSAFESGPGAAYVFERQANGTWVEQQKLISADLASGDSFGSPTIDGDIMILGTPHDDDNGSNSGSAYIFERQSDGTWLEVQKLLPSDGAAGEYFGVVSDLDGDTAIISAESDDDNGSGSGSVYVFEQQGNGSWEETAKLLASDGAAGDLFGFQPTIDGDIAVVGARGASAAYVFERQSDGSWVEVQKLVPFDGSTGSFGFDVALEGNTAIISAPDNDENGSRAGAAYLFRQQTNGVWAGILKLLPSDIEEGDFFGGWYSVSLSNATAIVASQDDDDFGESSGSVYVFEIP